MKFGRLTSFAIVNSAGVALKSFSRLWSDLCDVVETQEAGATKLANPYVAGAPAPTGYVTIEVDGVTYKILVST